MSGIVGVGGGEWDNGDGEEVSGIVGVGRR